MEMSKIVHQQSYYVEEQESTFMQHQENIEVGDFKILLFDS